MKCRIDSTQPSICEWASERTSRPGTFMCAENVRGKEERGARGREGRERGLNAGNSEHSVPWLHLITRAQPHGPLRLLHCTPGQLSFLEVPLVVRRFPLLAIDSWTHESLPVSAANFGAGHSTFRNRRPETYLPISPLSVPLRIYYDASTGSLNRGWAKGKEAPELWMDEPVEDFGNSKGSARESFCRGFLVFRKRDGRLGRKVLLKNFLVEW